MIWDVTSYLILESPKPEPITMPLFDGDDLIKDERYLELLNERYQRRLQYRRDKYWREKTGTEGRSKAS